MAFAETANLFVKMSLGGNFQSQLRKATSDLKKFDKDASRGYKAGVQIGTGIQRTAVLAAAGFGVLGVAIGKSLDVAGNFEAQLNTINTIAFTNADGLKKIGDGIRKIAKDTGLSLDDLTAGYYDLLSAGVKVTDAQAILNDSVTLGIGGLATTTEAVNLLTTAYNAYGLDAAGAAKATDMFAQAVADGKVKASEIADTFANVASIAKAYNVGIDQIAASYGYLTAQGVPAAEVTTEMNRAIISLIKPSKALLKAQDKLGVNFTDVLKKKGLVPALEILRKYSDKTGIPMIELLGRVEAVKYALQTTGPAAKGFADELKRIRDSSGEAAKQMAERQQGLNFQLGRLGAIVQDAGITLGTTLLPAITNIASGLNDLLNDPSIQTGIKDFGDNIAKMFSPDNIKKGFAALREGFGVIKDVAGTIADIVGKAVSAFTSLPPEVQKLLVGGFVVNKVTGGLVTNVVGGILSEIGKSLGIIKAPLVNVTGGVVNVEGGIGGGGIPGAGAAASAAGGIGIGTVASIAALAAVPLIPLVAAYFLTKNQSDLPGRTATAVARGLDPAKVPVTTQPGMQSPIADWANKQRAVAQDLNESSRHIRDAARTLNGADASAARSVASAAMRLDAQPANVTVTVPSKVNVYVTAGGIKRTINYTTRHGRSSGSRSGGTAATSSRQFEGIS